MIKENAFYKAKEHIAGMPTPGGYFYVYQYADTVSFGVAEQPQKELLTGSVFKVQPEVFNSMIDSEETY